MKKYSKVIFPIFYLVLNFSIIGKSNGFDLYINSFSDPDKYFNFDCTKDVIRNLEDTLEKNNRYGLYLEVGGSSYYYSIGGWIKHDFNYRWHLIARLGLSYWPNPYGFKYFPHSITIKNSLGFEYNFKWNRWYLPMGLESSQYFSPFIKKATNGSCGGGNCTDFYQGTLSGIYLGVGWRFRKMSIQVQGSRYLNANLKFWGGISLFYNL